MSYFENLNPQMALETLGLRRNEAHMADLVLPVLAAFGLGLGFGAGAALLLAPQTGRDLRDDLRERVGKLETSIRKSLPHRADVVDDGMDGPNTDHAYDGLSRSATS